MFYASSLMHFQLLADLNSVTLFCFLGVFVLFERNSGCKMLLVFHSFALKLLIDSKHSACIVNNFWQIFLNMETVLLHSMAYYL